jgi:tRNA(Met) cytidine acetyltransferase
VDDLAELAARLRSEAQRTGERRGLVLHGDRQRGLAAAARVLEVADVDPDAALLVGPDPDGRLRVGRVPAERSREVMGTTHAAVILDTHDRLDPNALGRTVGAVDGGGLYLLLTPNLGDWPDRKGGFDRSLAVPPYETSDVAGRFRRRLVETLETGEGIAIVDVDADEIQRDGSREASSASRTPPTSIPDRTVFPDAVYEACRTRDQADTVHALEGLLDPGQIVVVEADRGRGKSSAAGLAVGGLLERGAEVLVTAPRRSNVDEVFARAREVADQRDLATDEDDHTLQAGEGQLVYRRPLDTLAAADAADAIVVDEAAGLPVHLLERFLEPRTPVVFASTIHGYEGAGRGFSLRLQDRLDASPRPVHRLTMRQPIRYAAEDPLEAWSFQALLLDAEPAPGDAIDPVDPRQATYRAPSGAELVDDEQLLREGFGLLVLAHYRTTPSDLARLLDAPNVSMHCLTVEDRVLSVALTAREGGLGDRMRKRMYEGERVPGNLIPDVLTSQLRDPDAGRPVGKRVLRIATHPDHRRRGYASRLLTEIASAADVDWLGTSYGATPGLLAFWDQLGYRTVHLSARRNPTSGEHSAIQLKPHTSEGEDLTQRSEAWLLRRLPSVLADALDDVDPDLVRAALSGLAEPPSLAIGEREWRLVAAAAYGPGVYDIGPRAFRQLAIHLLVDGEVALDDQAERLLVTKVLQAREWGEVAEELGFASKRMAMRGLGEAYQPLVDAYGDETAHEEADRFR